MNTEIGYAATFFTRASLGKEKLLDDQASWQSGKLAVGRGIRQTVGCVPDPETVCRHACLPVCPGLLDREPFAFRYHFEDVFEWFRYEAVGTHLLRGHDIVLARVS